MWSISRSVTGGERVWAPGQPSGDGSAFARRPPANPHAPPANPLVILAKQKSSWQSTTLSLQSPLLMLARHLVHLAKHIGPSSCLPVKLAKPNDASGWVFGGTASSAVKLAKLDRRLASLLVKLANVAGFSGEDAGAPAARAARMAAVPGGLEGPRALALRSGAQRRAGAAPPTREPTSQSTPQSPPRTDPPRCWPSPPDKTASHAPCWAPGPTQSAQWAHWGP